MKELQLTKGQKRRLSQLSDNPDNLSSGAVEAFFAYTDRGERRARPAEMNAAIEFDALLMAHHHGVEAKWYRDSLADDFKRGIYFLTDFDGDRPFIKQAALDIYAHALGKTNYWEIQRSFWEL